MSAGHLRRDRTAVLPERARKIYAVCAHPLRALEPPFDLFPPPVQCGGCCALRATMIIRLRPYMAGPRPARSHCFRYFSQCLIFWCFWIKTKAHKKKIHDRRNRFFGKNSDAKIGCVVSAGRRPWDTPTVAGLRRRRLQPARRKGPQYFKPDCGVSQGRNLACTARCSVNSRKVRSSRRFPPVPLRSDRHDAPPDKQREPFPMKRFPFSFPRRIPPDPA